MTAQEFVRYMPADALAATVKHVYDALEPTDASVDVLHICWRQLVALVGEEEANEMVEFQDLSEVVA